MAAVDGQEVVAGSLAAARRQGPSGAAPPRRLRLRGAPGLRGLRLYGSGGVGRQRGKFFSRRLGRDAGVLAGCPTAGLSAAAAVRSACPGPVVDGRSSSRRDRGPSGRPAGRAWACAGGKGRRLVRTRRVISAASASISAVSPISLAGRWSTGTPGSYGTGDAEPAGMTRGRGCGSRTPRTTRSRGRIPASSCPASSRPREPVSARRDEMLGDPELIVVLCYPARMAICGLAVRYPPSSASSSACAHRAVQRRVEAAYKSCLLTVVTAPTATTR